MNREAARNAREWCWRAIRPDEEPHLVALGEKLTELRRAAHLSRPALAKLIRRSRRNIEHIEWADRRPRYSTLARIARALAPRLGRESADVLGELCRAAGPTISAERGTFPTNAYLGRRRPYLDPATGEWIGFEGVPKSSAGP